MRSQFAGNSECAIYGSMPCVSSKARPRIGRERLQRWRTSTLTHYARYPHFMPPQVMEACSSSGRQFHLQSSTRHYQIIISIRVSAFERRFRPLTKRWKSPRSLLEGGYTRSARFPPQRYTSVRTSSSGSAVHLSLPKPAVASKLPQQR